jgi:hypothetical protein
MEKHTQTLQEVMEVKVVQSHQVSDLEKLISLFERNEWEYQIAGFGKMITSPVNAYDWLFLPDYMDDSTIPQEGLDRLKAIEGLGINIQGMIIGHECIPVKEKRKPWITWDDEKTNKVLKWVAYALLAAAAVALIPVVLTVVCIGAALYVGVGDPSIIIVLDDADNTWVEVFFWFEES